MDKISKAKRSWNMSQIRARDTTPEFKVRMALQKAKYRFKLYDTNLPGKPDLVLQRYRTVVFVHGCFWHHHKGCKRANWPKSNKKYWIPKIKRNILRGKRIIKQLEKDGLRVIIIWECQTHKPEDIIKIFRKQLRKSTKHEI